MKNESDVVQIFLAGPRRDDVPAMIKPQIEEFVKNNPEITFEEAAKAIDKLLRNFRNTVVKILKNVMKGTYSQNTQTALRSCFWGQQDLSWITFYQFCGTLKEKMYDDESQELLNMWQDIGQSANWWWPYKEVVIISERPTICSINENRLLHSKVGPASEYSDGCGVWAIDGVRLPDADGEIIVMRPQEQTIEQINGEQNEEIRRIRIEQYGWPEYIKKSGAKVLDARDNDIDQQKECLVETVGGKRLVVSDPSTGRVYALGVPNEVNSCEEGQSWINHGLKISHRT